MNKNNTVWLLLILFFVIVKAFLLDGIATKTLNDFDEARYAEVAKNMLITGEYFIPLAGGPDEPRQIIQKKLPNGESLYPYFWKPPLAIWAQAISMKIFGINELALRLPSLMWAIGTLILLFLLSKKYGIHSEIIYGLVILFALSNDFSFLSTQGTTDSLLCFLGLLVVYLAHKKLQHRVVIGAGIITGLAILTKSIGAYWIPVIYIVTITVQKEFSLKNILAYVLSSFFVAAPWYIYMYVHFGDIFIYRHFVFNMRGGAEMGQNFAPIYWYFIYMIQSWKPLLLYIPFVAIATYNEVRKKNSLVINLLLWISLIIIPYSISHSKVWWYIFPLWPAVIILSGYSLTRFSKKIQYGVLLLSLAVAMFTGIYFSLHRPDWNSNTKKLAERNQNITRLVIIGKPYEAALYYFNTGNVQTASSEMNGAKYILTTKDALPLIGLTPVARIDQEGDLLLLRRIGVE